MAENADANGVTIRTGVTGDGAALLMNALASLAGRTPISVKDFGAVGDGETDDTSSVQAAADAAAGRMLLFPEGGTYVCDGIALSSGTTVSGYGATVTPRAASSAVSVFTVTGTADARKSDVTFAGLTFAGAGRAQTGIRATYTDRLKVRDCIGSGFTETSQSQGAFVYATNCDRPTVDNCDSDGGYYGVNFEATTGGEVRGGRYANVYRDGVLFYGGSHRCKAVGVTVKTFAIADTQGRGGIHAYGSDDVTVSGCVVEDSDTTQSDTGGIRFRDCRNFTCTGNYVEGGTTGILVNHLGDFAATETSGVITGNTVRATRLAGINIANTAGNVAVGPNAVLGCGTSGQHAVVCVLPGTTLSGLTIVDAGRAGIECGASCTVTGCTIVRANATGTAGQYSGIRVAGTNCTVSGNTVYDDRGTPLATSGVRILSSCSAVVGVNSFPAGVTTQVELSGTYLKGSVPWPNRFSGAPGGGTFETGCQSRDSAGTHYLCTAGGTPGTWKAFTTAA